LQIFIQMKISKLISILILFIGQYSILFSQNNKNFDVPKLSNQAQVSVLTIGLGTETYQLFGHSAIRIKDNKLGWDFVYNYGTFDFSDPDFLIKFIKGRLLYYESIDIYNDFVASYREQNRTIQEQILELDSASTQHIFEYLTINAREENKYYKYDFLFDNCATRPRDILLKIAYQSKLKFKPDVDDNSTYRQLIDRHNTNEWLDFGMDLLIGLPTDKKAKMGRTFLPYELMQLIDGATLNGKPIVKSNVEILSAIPNYVSKNWVTPGIVFWILFIMILILQIKQISFIHFKVFPIIFLSLLGLIGWLLIFMWFGTDHLSTKWNLNILWAMPLNFPLALFLIKKQTPNWIREYFNIYRIVLIVLLFFWLFNPQEYHKAALPLVLIAILFISRFTPIPFRKDLE
jgi:uncharacterized membrane protein